MSRDRRSTRLEIRIGAPADLDAVARQFAALWPTESMEEHRPEAASILAGQPKSTLPLVIFVAEVDGNVAGFIEVGLRSHADGCETDRPVGFVEGWYVESEHRFRGRGRALMRRAEDWARSKGCLEIASDTWLDHQPSQRAHEALGFEVVDRSVHYKKSLG